MNYAISSLTSVSDCDILLTSATAEKEALEAKVFNLTRACSQISAKGAQVTTDLADVNTELISVNGTLPTLTPGSSSYESAHAKQKRLELKQVLLGQKIDNYNTVALVDKQRELDDAQSRLTALMAYITELTTKKTALAV